MSILTTVSQTLAFEDDGGSNPSQKVEFRRTIANIPVGSPSGAKHLLEPLETVVLIDGTRSTSIDGTTAFSLSTSSLEASRYRIAHTGGTAPAFRTARSVPVNGVALTLVVNANLSVSVTAGAGTPFSAVQVGDIVFVPGAATGDATGPFDNLNVGYWTVLAVTGASISMARPSGTVFSGLGQVVTPSANSQFQVFSSAGVQVGDMVELSAGFASTARRAYSIVGVNPSWIEVLSTNPLGPEAGVAPGAAGMQFYSSAKRFLHVEADQECALRLNGDTGNTNRLEPWVAGDRTKVAEYRKVGPVWKLEVVNRSTVPLNLLVISAE